MPIIQKGMPMAKRPAREMPSDVTSIRASQYAYGREHHESFHRDRAFLWEAGTGMQDRGTLCSPWSIARGINTRGQIVRESKTAAGLTHAFLWEARTGMRDLGTFGGPFSIAYGINAHGVSLRVIADEFA